MADASSVYFIHMEYPYFINLGHQIVLEMFAELYFIILCETRVTLCLIYALNDVPQI